MILFFKIRAAVINMSMKLYRENIELYSFVLPSKVGPNPPRVHNLEIVPLLTKMALE